ncbi:bifunctional 4-hydroxy-2-oxoglutarate aldolase/2-dehydro-3-deoxy-phosphogluconate aldolase [Bryobacter aggregatus]|uniref:bifunctional 4-hydroxy-2-oxoglutarate aldolase/2-dehydro-3-deoxy-phosphogluconate aldolase n=1 Tax=Bryobacter aggregatus TaxID=360054 RepID=UPI0004E25B4F|nr:bifunctional 4-hydroxy-2-oxoglutarate aldolase/2-dehydro-3-deoxy-phosphogluconate aldolase [Bryobacter aggregatus]
MTKQQILSNLLSVGVVPVVRTATAEAAIRSIEALYEGGITTAEITMTVPGAIKALEQIAAKFGDKITLGAGTVLDPETCRICMLSGAEFFVTPNLNPKTIEMAKRYSKVILPGALTPTEVSQAWDAGADIVKVFPCGNVGGPKYIKALKGPFPQIEMAPTGGVNLDTTADFLRAGACSVAVGGELIDAATIKSGKYEVFTERARQYIALIQQTRAELAAAK